MVSNYDGEQIQVQETLPLLPVRDIVVYPFMILPLFVGREASIQAVEASLNQYDRMILLSSQIDITSEAPTPNDIYKVGTVAMIMRMRKLPDGRIKILIQGLTKAKITDFVNTSPYFVVKIEKMTQEVAKEGDISLEALMRSAREQLEKIISMGKVLSPDILMVLEDIQDPGRLADLIASNLGLRVDEGQEILETVDPIERLHKITKILNRELDVLALQAKIKHQAQDEISKNQREYFLREQMRAIKSELGEAGADKEDEAVEFKEKIYAAKMPQDVEKEAIKQLNRLEKMHPDSSESSILRTYLECLVELPWSKASEEDLDLNHAKQILDDDHFDLYKIKERILEHLAVRALRGPNMKGPILCFIGPPGVGKTSLGKSIARAIGREFVRISLGGVKDEAEIRGHRRTYVGAMPGRFIQAMKQAGYKNPIIMLDEIDKLGSDFRGDPSSALLEVLDPEQNNHFIDHYVNLPYDLSNTMFIATANTIDTIPGPLRDRMEMLTLPGYTQEEKLSITNKYLVKKQVEENGLTDKNIEFTDEGIVTIIQHYTAEAGLRNLERQVASICRKVAKKVASGENKKITINRVSVEKMLGPHIFTREDLKTNDEVGVATGLAWTVAGGEILNIEATRMKGKGLTLTGQLGDVMKESAMTALSLIRGEAKRFGIDENIFENSEIHIHIPAGAIPKDGPSAGITLATTIISLLTNCPVDRQFAMTGEITLRGHILPVGGVKEKALAAMRVGIKNVIIPWKNKKDIIEIPEEYRRKIKFVPVKNIEEVLSIVLIGFNDLLKSNLAKKDFDKSFKQNKLNKSDKHKTKVKDHHKIRDDLKDVA